MLRFRSVSNWRGWRETLPKEALAPDRRALNSSTWPSSKSQLRSEWCARVDSNHRPLAPEASDGRAAEG
jgi:hypothetical protein